MWWLNLPGLALAAYALVRLARVAGMFKAWRERKPLVCNPCVSGWAGAIVAALEVVRLADERGLGRVAVAWLIALAAAGACLLLVEILERRPPPPPPLDLQP